jgi:hypothetical protein
MPIIIIVVVVIVVVAVVCRDVDVFGARNVPLNRFL